MLSNCIRKGSLTASSYPSCPVSAARGLHISGFAHSFSLLPTRRSIAASALMSQDMPQIPVECADAEVAGPGGAAEAPSDPTVQYVVLRRDLWMEQGWPLGSVVAQACHASVAAVWLHSECEVTMDYLAPEKLDHMHKVVLEVKGETQLNNLSEKLREAGILHKLWIEQPENYPTCLATKPYPKSQVAAHFKKFNLCKSMFTGK